MSLHLRTLYHNFIIVFVFVVFSAGLQYFAYRALLSGGILHQTLEVIGLCSLISIPITLFMVFKGVKPIENDTLSDIANVILISSLIIYITFIVFALVPVNAEILHM